MTGATGFIGSAITERLRLERKHSLRMLVRHAATRLPEGLESLHAPDLGADADWRAAVAGVDAVIHAAARAHVMKDNAVDRLAAYRSVNTAGTLNLARQAAEAGVRRFVFVSSIKVNGEQTLPSSAFLFNCENLRPNDAYGISKHEAEVGLLQISKETEMEVVIIRPPLVYGPGAKGNLASMLRWLQRGLPLPLGAATENRRSLVALDNLVDLIVTCIDHPAAANETFLVSDGEDLSTTDLLRRLGSAMGKPARLLPVPPILLQGAAKLLGKVDVAQRLLGNLQVDISYTCETLGWRPLISVDEGLRRAVQGLK